jgi:hypothetical protein
MSKILTETSRVISVKATNSDANYKYETSYDTDIDGKTLNSANVIVKKGDNAFVGSMNFNNGSKNFNFQDGVSISDMDAMFTAIIAEIKSGLTA